jgi:rubrerythrin
MRSILVKAIEREEDAVKFYTHLRESVRNPGTKTFMTEMIEQETRHKEILLTFIEDPGKLATFQAKTVQGLGIAALVEPVKADPDLTYQDALIVAMKREEGSVRFYEGLRKATREPSLIHLLDLLVGEEKLHRERLETEYDQNILTED